MNGANFITMNQSEYLSTKSQVFTITFLITYRPFWGLGHGTTAPEKFHKTLVEISMKTFVKFLNFTNRWEDFIEF